MTEAEQIEIMETQIGYLDGLVSKTAYLATFFKPDPAFSQSAIDQVIAKLSRDLVCGCGREATHFDERGPLCDECHDGIVNIENDKGIQS